MWISALALVAAMQQAPAPVDTNIVMVDAAKKFVASLDDVKRATVTRPFDDKERTTWSYVRAPRGGLLLTDMSDEQRSLALALVNSVLSDQGRERVRLVRAVEEIVRAEDEARQAPASTGTYLYSLMVFGEPGVAPWGWRLEGHHLGLHFSSVARGTTVTPLFFGSFPDSLRSGPEQGKRPLGALQDAAIELRRSLTAEQAQRATIADGAPADILTGPGREAALRDPASQRGVAMTDLDQKQRDLLWALVVRHAADLRGDLASDELRRIKDAGTEKLRFGWAGEAQVDKPHYFRIAGPTFVIEFDCTQGNPEHVHCVWNDPERNFGGDPLREHAMNERKPRG